MSWFKEKVEDWDMVGKELRRQGVEFDISQLARLKDISEEDEEEEELAEINVDVSNLTKALTTPKDASADQLEKLKSEAEKLIAGE